jgi:hypothetical protein
MLVRVDDSGLDRDVKMFRCLMIVSLQQHETKSNFRRCASVWMAAAATITTLNGLRKGSPNPGGLC